MKNHNLIQKGMKDDLAKGKNISQFQGMLSKARENSSEFSNKIK